MLGKAKVEAFVLVHIDYFWFAGRDLFLSVVDRVFSFFDVKNKKLDEYDYLGARLRSTDGKLKWNCRHIHANFVHRHLRIVNLMIQ